MNCSKFKFDKKTVSLLDELQIKTKSSSRSETIGKALYLLKTLTESQTGGKRMFIQDEYGKDIKEIILF